MNLLLLCLEFFKTGLLSREIDKVAERQADRGFTDDDLGRTLRRDIAGTDFIGPR